MKTLHADDLSPGVAGVRAILGWKRLPFEEVPAHPARRGLLGKLTGRARPPVLVDSGAAIVGATAIARHLEERHPERPIVPAEPALRARALLLEQWAGALLPRVVEPVRFLISGNFSKEIKHLRSSYPPGAIDDAIVAALGRALRHRAWWRHGRPAATVCLNRLAEAMRVLDGALAETGYLAGPAPSVADFAVYGFVAPLDGLDGWETVKTHRRVIKLLKALAPDAAPAAPEAYDAQDEALLDASRLRRAGA